MLSLSSRLLSATRRPVLRLIPPSVTLSTNVTTTSFNIDKFCKTFINNVQGVTEATDPTLSSRELRKLVKSKTLKFTDMKENPEKFFMAHRLLSTIGEFVIILLKFVIYFNVVFQ